MAKKETVKKETAKSSNTKKMVGDVDSTVEIKLRTLFHLQRSDSAIDQIRLLRGELPLEVQDLEDEIQGLKTRITNVQAEVKELEATVAQKKLDAENSKALIKKYEAQQNNVKNNREYDSITKEIEYQGLEEELAEKRIKEYTALVKERKGQLDEAKKTHVERQQDLVIKRKELEEIIAETSKEEKELMKKSEELQKQIDSRLLTAYKKLRANAQNGLAVVTVRRDACGGCFNKIPPQRQTDIILSKKIIVCEYCGRILVDSVYGEE